MAWKALQLSTSGLRGTCYAAKTTTWHGLSGKGPDSSWVLRWLGHLAALLAQHQQQRGRPQPDFAFINCALLASEISILAPASYSRTLLQLRWLAQHTGLLGSALLASEAQQVTLRSTKSTLVACAAQLKLSEEHRVLQGHHRSSARLYSRNDTFGSMHLRRCITEAVCGGFRPQRSMFQGAQAPLPEPAFVWIAYGPLNYFRPPA